MTTPKNVIFDIDGVLADFNTPFAKLLSERSGIPLDQFTFTEWYWYRKTGIDKKLVRQAWDDVVNNPADFWLNLKLINSPQTALDIMEIEDLGLEPVFVTARNPKLRAITNEWLYERLGIRNPYLILSPKKGHICEALDAIAFLDDKYDNCLDVLRMRGTKTLVALRDQPYNRSTPPDPYLHRLSGVREFCQLLADKTPGRD